MSMQDSQNAAYEIARDLESELVDSALSRRLGYQARIELSGNSLGNMTNIEDSLAAHRFDDGVVIGLRARLRASIRIDSPTRGLSRKSSDWGTTFSPEKLGSGITAFGQQLAAIEAFGGVLRTIEVHIIHPPKGKRVVGWNIE